jgi:hypothetical protein
METGDNDEIAESLIETFPASDPPSWIPLARVGLPKRNRVPTRPTKLKHPM